MNIYILLSICPLTLAIEDRGLWDLLENIISFTHKSYVPEDARLNITQLAQKYGYPLEEHTVTTEDGYILNMHRIANRKYESDKPVVFLMHGILECSDSWLLMGPGKALAYVLADEGFDVWMGNARGNKHSNLHTSLNSSVTKYWEFSWEEIAVNDLPAMIDYILETTTHHSLYYIGHSQGTTVGYVLCSMKPEYNDKIKIMFSLAPEAWMGNVKSPIVRMFSPAHNVLGFMLKDFNAFSAGLDFFNKISAFVCTVLPGRCDNIMFAISGYENKVNDTLLSIILGHMPTGSSTLQFVHYGQLVQSHKFRRYDYGDKRNMDLYGQTKPPDYDLSKVSVPIMIFYSSKDWLSDPEDVETLISHLPDVEDAIFFDDYTHIDYVYASDATNTIYQKIIERIQKFERGATTPVIDIKTTGTKRPRGMKFRDVASKNVKSKSGMRRDESESNSSESDSDSSAEDDWCDQ